jgi:hypothetical protein
VYLNIVLPNTPRTSTARLSRIASPTSLLLLQNKPASQSSVPQDKQHGRFLISERAAFLISFHRAQQTTMTRDDRWDAQHVSGSDQGALGVRIDKISWKWGLCKPHRCVYSEVTTRKIGQTCYATKTRSLMRFNRVTLHQ